MGKGIKEWPGTDILQRKYVDSWVIMENVEGILSQHWIDGCEAGSGGTYIFYTRITNGNFEKIDALPVYFNIESGYYTSQKEEVILIERRFNAHKNFKVGMCNTGWVMYKVNTGTGEEIPIEVTKETRLDLIGGPERNRFLSRDMGAICRKYFVSHGNIFYKGSNIGCRDEHRILLDNSVFRKDLQNILGPTWQVS